MDENFAPVKIDDPENEGEKKTALICFPCKGTKVGGVIEFLRELGKKADELEPLSSNAEFNKTVITPRRFITEVTVGTAKTAHGDKYVYKFMPHKILPNETVKEIMDKSQALMDKFEKQYNKTSSVQLPSSGVESSAIIQENSGVTFGDDSSAEEQKDVPAEQLGTIDLGL